MPPTRSPRATVIQGIFLAGQPRFHLRAPRPQDGHPRILQLHGATGGHGHTFSLPENLSSFGSGAGQPLPNPVRQKMESYFGTSFAEVRVHIGTQASSIGALAFTCGSNLYFAPGQYNPDAIHGQRLLGHELTHVVQQRSGRVRNPFGSGVAVVQDRSMEAEADRMGLQAAAHRIAVQGKPAAPRAGIPCGAKVAAQMVGRVVTCKPAPVIQRSHAAQRTANATLTIKGKQYEGKASGQYGHAEMDALRKFIIEHETFELAAASLAKARAKTVTCPEPDVCSSCNLVLTKLGFTATADTTLSDQPSGGVSWGASAAVQTVMGILGLDDVYKKALLIGAKG